MKKKLSRLLGYAFKIGVPLLMILGTYHSIQELEGCKSDLPLTPTSLIYIIRICTEIIIGTICSAVMTFIMMYWVANDTTTED